MTQSEEQYAAAFHVLLNTTDDLTRVLLAWHKASAEAEAAWDAIPENKRRVWYSPRCLNPSRNPAVKGMIRPPEHLLGLPITVSDAPPQ